MTASAISRNDRVIAMPSATESTGAPSLVEAAWLAAAIDGEGSICVYVQKRGPLRLSIKPSLTVSNSVRAFVEKAQACAHTGTIAAVDQLAGDREQFQWATREWAACERILMALHPHLVVKQDRARALLLMCQVYRHLLANSPPTQEGKPRERLRAEEQATLAAYALENWFTRFQVKTTGHEAVAAFVQEVL